MAKLVNLGNGKVLIGLDEYGRVKDFYYHYAGLEDHVSEHLVHKIGVFVEDSFNWLGDGSWEIEIGSQKDTMASDIRAVNKTIGIELNFTDVVYNEKNIFIREIVTKNLFDRRRKLKIFFNQQFNIAQTHVGDTAYYAPRCKAVIHYKGRRVFLINALDNGKGITDYGVGLLGIEGKDGTYKDAEDGSLSKNPIEHGQVDSVVAIDLQIEPNKAKTSYYWICVGKSIGGAMKLNEFVLRRHPLKIMKTTIDYWRAWVGHQKFSFYGLEPEVVNLFNKSLINIRTHVSSNGAIIASGDSDLLQFGRDTYSYVWPRDAAFCAIALQRSGDFNASRRFFRYCADIITPEGFFMHKYRPDKSLGSSWHPWVSGGKKQLPIQEDETALVMYALWQHYILSKDLEFIEEIYNDLIKKATEFMVSYIDEKTGLPKPSYDLWEQTYGVSTFTASTVFGALKASARFAGMLGKVESEKKYLKVSDGIQKAIMKYLYDKKGGYFYKQVSMNKGNMVVDKTIDMSSVYGIFKFEVLPISDKRLKLAMEKAVERLTVKTEVSGIARYEGDSYHHAGGDIPGNPWIITTMWLAQYYIALAKNVSEMKEVFRWFKWAVKYAGSAGILPEQLNPYTSEYLSATPLAWSHAEYITTVIEYLEKLEELGICKACYPLN
jgi:oligosaccharide amylase